MTAIDHTCFSRGMLGLLLAAWFLAACHSNRREIPPNIVVFLVDDLGWQDSSVPFWPDSTAFNKTYVTPNLERLAALGVKFTHAYATPLCTPTRVSLLTGVNAARHRVTQWTHPDAGTSTDVADSLFHAVDWNINGLSPEAGVDRTFHATPLPALLKTAGYLTILSGKAHFGAQGTPGADPENLGFDINIAGSEIGHPASYSGLNHYDRRQNGNSSRHAVSGLESYHGQDVFLTDALTSSALEAVDNAQQAGRPFFLYLAHYAVHTPLEADKRFADKYYGGLDSAEAAYASLIEGVDKSLGDVLAFLESRGITDNTVIIFTSDNGGLSRVPPRGGGEADIHNLPLRAGKGSVYEGGIRVPLIVKWPGVAEAGTVTHQQIIVEDLFPTLLEIAGITQLDGVIQQVDGVSFVSRLRNPDQQDSLRALVWHHPNRWVAGDGALTSWASAVRKGDWKLLYDYANTRLELYNVKEDIGEQNNLIDQYPGKAKELAQLFTKLLKERGAQLPAYKDSGKTVTWPDELIK